MRKLIIPCLLLLSLPACGGAAISQPATQSIPGADAPTFPETAAPTQPPSFPAASFTPPPTDTLPITPVPTYAVLRGEVLERLNCRYGPGPDYLYFTGLVKGSNLEVIGRRDDGKWIYVRAIGGSKPCWINAKYMAIQGEVMSLEPVYPEKAPLPKSPYYPPTDWVGATRGGNSVEVSWHDVPLKAGDEEDADMQHYIIEVWRCEGGQIVFEPLATNDLSVTFGDEPGCGQPSHGRVFVQEKHGFAGPTEIPWPPYEGEDQRTPSPSSP